MDRWVRHGMRGAVALMLAVGGAGRAFAQACPAANTSGPPPTSRSRTLDGRLVYHDGIRQWFELKLSAPQCGQRSIQLLQLDQRRTIERFRGCRVRSRGPIDFSTTGYYSRDLFQDVQGMEPIGACRRRPPLPDPPKAKPDRRVRAYRVTMLFDNRPGDHPVRFIVADARGALRPWQAYAGYLLTGGFVLYGQCGEGFMVDRVWGPREARPSHFGEPRSADDMAAFDPEGAAQAGKSVLRLGYSCARGG